MTGLGGYIPQRRIRALAGGLLVCACALPVSAQDQDDPGGAEFTLTFTERLLWEDDEINARSDLDLSLVSDTRTQTFAFTLRGGLNKQLSGGLETSWEDPFARLAYGVESRNTALSFDASYRQADADSLVFDTIGDGTLVLDEGTRENSTANARLEFGREAPFGGTVSLGWADTRYLDTTDASLIDSTTQRANLGLRFDIDRRITARIDVDHSDVDRDGGLDVRRDRISAGLTLDVTQALRADVDLGRTRVVQSGSVPRSTSQGFYGRVALQQEMVNGTLSGSLVSNLDEYGRRTTARVDRALELPRAELSYGLGVSTSDSTDTTRPLFALSYAQDLPRGDFRISLDQAFSSTSAGAETLNTRLSLTARQELSSLSVLTGALSLREANVLGTGGDDSSEITLSLNYSQTLTERWALVAGYTHTRLMQDSGTDSTDDEVFIGLRTTLAWRP